MTIGRGDGNFCHGLLRIRPHFRIYEKATVITTMAFPKNLVNVDCAISFKLYGSGKNQ